MNAFRARLLAELNESVAVAVLVRLEMIMMLVHVVGGYVLDSRDAIVVRNLSRLPCVSRRPHTLLRTGVSLKVSQNSLPK